MLPKYVINLFYASFFGNMDLRIDLFLVTIVWISDAREITNRFLYVIVYE